MAFDIIIKAKTELTKNICYIYLNSVSYFEEKDGKTVVVCNMDRFIVDITVIALFDQIYNVEPSEGEGYLIVGESRSRQRAAIKKKIEKNLDRHIEIVKKQIEKAKKRNKK